MTRVVIAPDKFTGSLTAPEAAAALATGLRAADAALDLVIVPVADGGDGTVDAAVAAGFEQVPVVASGPTGVLGPTSYARRDETAVVELASVCGFSRLPGGVPDPLGATSRGLGEVLRQAVSAGAARIIVGLGGSASTDGGRGLLEALDGVDLSGIELIVASDVANPLLGPDGAAAVYAPQKGATPEQVAELERRLDDWADVVGRAHVDTPGAGAAGGVGFALLSLGATLRPGIEVVLELAHFEQALAGAALVITGEGSLDEQTLQGKAPAGVAAAARRAGVPVVAVAGTCSIDASAAGFAASYPLSDLEPDRERSMRDAAALLERLGRTIASDLPGFPAGARPRTPEPSTSGETR